MRNESGSSSGLVTNVRLKFAGRSPSPHLTLRKSPSRSKIFPESASVPQPAPSSPGSRPSLELFYREFPRTNTGFSTASEVRREQNLRAKFSEILSGRHSTVQTWAWVKRRKMDFDLRRWSQSLQNNSDTRINNIPSAPVSLVDALSEDQIHASALGSSTTTELTARQFALMARMKILFLSDKDEEQQPLQKATIMDPNFFSSPKSQSEVPVPINVDSASLHSVATTSAETLSASILTFPSNVSVSEFSHSDHQTGAVPIPIPRNSPPDSISNITPASQNTQSVKIGRFMVSEWKE